MQQFYPMYNRHIGKNKFATASFVLSIISIILLISIIPLAFTGGLLMSCAGQSPDASGIDTNNPEELERYIHESRSLGNTGITLFIAPSLTSGIIGVLGLIFGIIGASKPYKRAMAIFGIVLSGIPVCIGVIFFSGLSFFV